MFSEYAFKIGRKKGNYFLIIVHFKVTEKLSKCKDLEIEIERMWGMKATTIPVVIGALGLIKKGLENIKISELQKTALLGTSRILRKTLSIK